MSNTRTTTTARAAKKATAEEVATKAAEREHDPANLPDTVEFDFDGHTYTVNTLPMKNPTMRERSVMRRVVGDASTPDDMLAFYDIIGVPEAGDIRDDRTDDFREAMNAALGDAEEMNLGESSGSEG